MKDRNERFLGQLEFWLRVGGVNRARVVSILSEVRTHLADSGEDPYEAFGPARLYAKAFLLGSSWSWGRCAAGFVALAALAAGCYAGALDVAHLRTQRPLWRATPQWFAVMSTLLLLLIGWRALLYFASRRSTSLAGEGVDPEKAWKKRVALLRAVSLGLLVVVIVASGTWGSALGHSYLSAPKLRVTDFVYSAANQNSPSDIGVSVRTVIYLDAPGPDTTLNMAALTLRQDPGGTEASSLQGFNSLAQALRTAKDISWTFYGDQLPGFTLNFGSYYVLTWTDQIYSTYTSNPSAQEHLVITYLVAGVGLKTLSIPLAVNS